MNIIKTSALSLLVAFGLLSQGCESTTHADEDALPSDLSASDSSDDLDSADDAAPDRDVDGEDAGVDVAPTCDGAGPGCSDTDADDIQDACACPSLDGAVGTCDGGGACAYRCEDGYDNCDGDMATGCDALTSDEHCGACLVACGADEACEAGTCVPLCGAAGPCSDGTECCEDTCVDTGSSAEHCGGCLRSCAALPNVAQGDCISGICVVTCATGFLDCDGEPGCETDALTSSSCGACGIGCAADEVCAGDVAAGEVPSCQCPSGMLSCAAGCVPNLEHTSCGLACDALVNCLTDSLLCVDGVCSCPACAVGANCAPIGGVPCQCGQAGDSDPCYAGSQCCNGSCFGFDDPRHCGACNNACVGGQTCLGGQCN